MKIEELLKNSRTLLQDASPLGFDGLAVMQWKQTELAIRIANNTVCRENISNENTSTLCSAAWNSREGKFHAMTTQNDVLRTKLTALRHDLGQQSANQEYVQPALIAGKISCNPCGSDAELDDVFSPERLYPLLEANIKKCRERGLRASGFLTANALQTAACLQNGSEILTHDMGLSVKFAVDNPATHASGASKAAVLGCAPWQLESEIGRAMDEAIAVCVQSEQPREIPAGDYTVILTPSALRELILVLAWYGFFNRRNIDEGRTYLSGRHTELQFPQSLTFRVEGSLGIADNLRYKPLALNSRFVPSSAVELIANGKVNDFFYPAFWSQKLSRKENLCGFEDVSTFELEFSQDAAKTSGLSVYDDLNQLIKNTERAILINDLWYLRMVSPMDGIITGMTRDGVLEVKDGQIVGAVRNMRWHDNPLRILSSISAATSTRSLLGQSQLSGGDSLSLIPAVRVENFHFSSVTKF